MERFGEIPGVPIGSENPVHLSRLTVYESRLLRVNPSAATRFSVHAEYLTSRSYPTPTPRRLAHFAVCSYIILLRAILSQSLFLWLSNRSKKTWTGIPHCVQQ